MDEGSEFNFISDWISFIGISAIFLGSLYLLVKILGPDSGKKIDNAFDKIRCVITYPVNLLYSIVPDRGHKALYAFLYTLYIAGYIGLIIFIFI